VIVASQLPKHSCVTPIRTKGEGTQTLTKFAADYCNRWSFPKTRSSQKKRGGQPGANEKNGGGHGPSMPPRRIATGYQAGDTQVASIESVS